MHGARECPYVFPLRARDFQAVVDHPYLPLKLGRKLTYKEGAKTVTIEVLRQRRDLDGIPVTVVRDRSVEDGETDEDTLDFFAQKRDGTVVYLGEFTAVFESGIQAATSGSFLAGYASGFGYGEPLAGVTMPGNPKIAKSYRLEFDAGNAEEYYTTAGTCGTVVTRPAPSPTPSRSWNMASWSPRPAARVLRARRWAGACPRSGRGRHRNPDQDRGLSVRLACALLLALLPGTLLAAWSDGGGLGGANRTSGGNGGSGGGDGYGIFGAGNPTALRSGTGGGGSTGGGGV